LLLLDDEIEIIAINSTIDLKELLDVKKSWSPVSYEHPFFGSK
jgi:hypothetical protein